MHPSLKIKISLLRSYPRDDKFKQLISLGSATVIMILACIKLFQNLDLKEA